MKVLNALKDAGQMRLIERRGVFPPPTRANVLSEVVLVDASEPTIRYDQRRNLVYQEYLHVAGVQWRTDRRQLPLIDGGDRSTIRNVCGSVRDIRNSNGRLIGRVAWASDERSQAIARKVMAGHVDRFEIEASPISVQRIDDGQRMRTVVGDVEGPADVVLTWRPISVALISETGTRTTT